MCFWRAIIFVCVIPAIALSQFNPNSAKIQNEDELFLALLSVSTSNQSSAESLLRDHENLVNEGLWQRLTETASRLDPTRASALSADAQWVANDLRDRRLVAGTYYKTGRYQFSRGEIAPAIENLLRSKQAFEDAGLKRDLIYVLADLGTLHIYSSQYEKAKEYSEQSIALASKLKTSNVPVGAFPDEYGVATAWSNLGDVANWDGDHEKAIENYQRSLALYQKLDHGSSKYGENILDDLADIGRTYRRLGDHVQALIYLNKAIELARTLGIADRVASISNSLGILYSEQRDYSKALGFYQEGLQFAVAANERRSQANLLLNIAVVFQAQKEYDKALDNFAKSLEIAKALSDKETIIVVGEGLGAIYKEQGKYKEALETFGNSLALAREIGDRTKLAELYWRTAEAQYAKGDYSGSISNSSEAIRLADQLNLQNVSYLALTTLGRAQRAEKQDDLAAQAFSKAIACIEENRHRIVGAEQESERFFEDKVGPYREMVDLLASRKTRDGNARALLYAERAKARVLADVLKGGRAELASVMTTQEKQDEKTLNRNIVALNVQLGQESTRQIADAAQVKNLNEQLHAARLKYETFQDSVYASHPELKGRSQQTRAVTLDGISQVVRDDKSAFLEYAVTKERTYLFVMTRKQQGLALDLRAYAINLGERELAQKAAEFRRLIASRDPSSADSSRELYDLLIKPAEEQLKGTDTLCIVPDGSLWEVPFQALEAKDNRYLLQSYASYYAPSLDVLTKMSKKESNSRSGSASLLAFGNPKLANEIASNVKAVYRDESLAPLPEAETEVKALREIWGPSGSRVLIGADAGKKVFKAEAANYQIIHLATHGILDDGNPMYSRLMMARVESDPDDDGFLEAREIMHLNLNANLVVLSACQTARGRIGAGEGVVGISWAFFLAGVPTTVVSQWKVESESTATLMINFHRHLKATDGVSKAQALRQAALDLLKDKSYQHPFYWAGFVMIGNGM